MYHKIFEMPGDHRNIKRNICTNVTAEKNGFTIKYFTLNMDYKIIISDANLEK